jgi:hypothetical protein
VCIDFEQPREQNSFQPRSEDLVSNSETTYKRAQTGIG